MAHDLNSLRQVAERARVVPGSMKLRRFQVFAVHRDWSGEFVGDGNSGDCAAEILEAGYPPKVRAMSGEELAVNGLDSDTYKIGPITPSWSVGADSGGVAKESVVPTNEEQYAERHYVITGGEFGDAGKRMRLKSFDYDRNFRYMLWLQPVEAD